MVAEKAQQKKRDKSQHEFSWLWLWLWLLVPPLWRKPNRLKRIGSAISQDINAMISDMRRLIGVSTEETPKEKAEKLQKNMLSTYSNLRYGLAVIGLLFPLLLWFIGKYWHGIPLQSSMSAYYYAESTGEGPIHSWFTSLNLGPINAVLFVLGKLDNQVPMRSWFVGILFALGIFLYLYKGWSMLENLLLNVAGLSAVGVALFPMERGCDCWISVHSAFAGTVFVSMGLVALCCSGETLRTWQYDQLSSKDQEKWKTYRNWYWLIGFGMFVFPFFVWIAKSYPFVVRAPISVLLGDNWADYSIFIIECFGVMAFSLYWLIKSNELSEKRAEKHIAEKHRQLSPNQPVDSEKRVEEYTAEKHPQLSPDQ